jgi:protein-S-isoprenylcysteine O-methyltransferase Ste14
VLPLIYTNIWAFALFMAACLVWNAPEAVGMLRQRAKVARLDVASQDHHSMTILIGLQLLGLALNFLLAAVFPQAAIPWRLPALLVGVGLMLLGVAFRWYAIRTLGAYFTRDVAVSAQQPVMQRGPYRYIRHPSYTGTFITMLGVGVATGNWAGLIMLLVCVVAGHLYRVRIEERALAQTIGQPYVDYIRRTKRFIPGVV